MTLVRQTYYARGLPGHFIAFSLQPCRGRWWGLFIEGETEAQKRLRFKLCSAFCSCALAGKPRAHLGALPRGASPPRQEPAEPPLRLPLKDPHCTSEFFVP